jgi:hypothetical protein
MIVSMTAYLAVFQVDLQEMMRSLNEMKRVMKICNQKSSSEEL